MKNKTKISALLITYNEIDHIEAVIENISFADEIIVVDSFSTDGTLDKLAEFKNVKTITRKFKNFADQILRYLKPNTIGFYLLMPMNV